ncbi:MAG: hypothetical protein JWR35_711 [Marmoricola sp.]|jgi:hypothetical protein|nr:hypothetical protein [Marmoricola sp.]
MKVRMGLGLLAGALVLAACGSGADSDHGAKTLSTFTSEGDLVGKSYADVLIAGTVRDHGAPVADAIVTVDLDYVPDRSGPRMPPSPPSVRTDAAGHYAVRLDRSRVEADEISQNIVLFGLDVYMKNHRQGGTTETAAEYYPTSGRWRTVGARSPEGRPAVIDVDFGTKRVLNLDGHGDTHPQGYDFSTYDVPKGSGSFSTISSEDDGTYFRATDLLQARVARHLPPGVETLPDAQ